MLCPLLWPHSDGMPCGVRTKVASTGVDWQVGVRGLGSGAGADAAAVPPAAATLSPRRGARHELVGGSHAAKPHWPSVASPVALLNAAGFCHATLLMAPSTCDRKFCAHLAAAKDAERSYQHNQAVRPCLAAAFGFNPRVCMSANMCAGTSSGRGFPTTLGTRITAVSARLPPSHGGADRPPDGLRDSRLGSATSNTPRAVVALVESCRAQRRCPGLAAKDSA